MPLVSRLTVGAAAITLVALILLPALSNLALLPLAVVAVLVGRSARGVPIGAAAFLLALALGSVVSIVTRVPLQEALVHAALAVTFGALPWLLAVAWRSRRRLEENEAATLARHERERQHEADLARARERAQLAEELHDDLGHALSLVALNLGRLELDPGLSEDQRAALGATREHVAAAVERLGASVEALHGDEAPRAVPRAGDVADLVARARSAGAEVTVTGEAEVAAYGTPTVVRVVQEGITNAVKHAPGSPVEISFTDVGGWLEVAVRNSTGTTPPRTSDRQSSRPADGEQDRDGGLGLVALHERVRMTGGTLDTRSEGGRFTLTVRLPRLEDQSPVRSSPDHPSAATAEQAFRQIVTARRRSRRRLWLAALAPVAVLLVIVVAVQAATLAEARRALLAPQVFAEIEVGAGRSEVERLLPERELPWEQDDEPAGGDCHYYAVTADPLDDASGDAYRICYSAGVVVTAEQVRAEDS